MTEITDSQEERSNGELLDQGISVPSMRRSVVKLLAFHSLLSRRRRSRPPNRREVCGGDVSVVAPQTGSCRSVVAYPHVWVGNGLTRRPALAFYPARVCTRLPETVYVSPDHVWRRYLLRNGRAEALALERSYAPRT